jgi:hypothetical protein
VNNGSDLIAGSLPARALRALGWALRPGMLAVPLVGLLIAALVLHPHGTGGRSSTSELVGFGNSVPLSLSTPVAGSTPAAGIGASVRPFSISGKVTGLFPGRVVPLNLTVHNPNSYAITITSIRTVVESASTQCTSANVSVSAFSGKHVVGARASGIVGVKVTMRRGAPNACQGKAFPFRYAGTAKGG